MVFVLGAEIAVGEQFLLVMPFCGFAVVFGMKGELGDLSCVLTAEPAKGDQVSLSRIFSDFDSKIYTGIGGAFPLGIGISSIFREHLSPFVTPPVKNPNLVVKLRS